MGQVLRHSPAEKIQLDSLMTGLSSGSYNNVVVLCGAGISTSAGVPDFRTPSLGLYSKIRQIENLPYPEAVFDGDFFASNPKPFYSLVRQIYPEKLTPTTTHKFFKLLENKGYLLRVYTQNIDALEFLAGLPEEKVVEAHGTFQRSYCTKCRKLYDLSWLKKEIFTPESNDGVPKCDACGGVVRPDVVFFGESLPSRFWTMSSVDFEKCDLVLVFGTSLSVAPFNSLVGKANSKVPRVYINKTKPGSAGGLIPWFMGLKANVNFDRSSDTIILDDCDRTVEMICNETKWTEDLQQITVNSLEP